MGYKEEFISIFEEQIVRDGSDKLLEWLQKTDFFTTPASTKFHLSNEGGLLQHSLNVCEMALGLRDLIIQKNPDFETRLPKESVIIASLLHDVCKSDIYKRKALNTIGNKVLGKEVISEYVVDFGQHPFGHGEKSVIMLLQNGLKLTNEEALAIRWHMHAWDIPMQSPEAKGNFNKAKSLTPLVQLLIAADGLASQILEHTV